MSRPTRSGGIARMAAVSPAAMATSTTVVPSTIPTKYGRVRRMPYADPAATRLSVDGPGLAISATAVTASVPSAPQWTGCSGSVVSMPGTLEAVGATGLERSCGGAVRWGSLAPGIRTADVRLSGAGFEPHRHGDYAIGITTSGVQLFSYHGSRWACLPGQLHFLYPDEPHDGGPGTDD